MNGSGNPRFVGLDAARGLAAGLVVIHHIGTTIGDKSLAPLGYLAVDIFFVMSGFVMARAYEPRLASSELSRWDFCLIRIVRLYPLIFAGLVVGLILKTLSGTFVPGFGVVANFLLLPDMSVISGPVFRFNDPIWSIFFELIANLIHVLVLAKFCTKRLMQFTAVLFVVFVVTVIQFRSTNVGWGAENFIGGIPRVLFSYCMGILIFRMRWDDRLRNTFGIGAWLILLAALLLVPAIGFTVPRSLLTITIVFPVLVAGITFARSSVRGKAFFKWAGHISYPLYAIHFPIVMFAGHLFGGPHSLVEMILFWSGIILLVVGVAHVFAMYYDGPARRMLGTLLQTRKIESSAAG